MSEMPPEVEEALTKLNELRTFPWFTNRAVPLLVGELDTLRAHITAQAEEIGRLTQAVKLKQRRIHALEEEVQPMREVIQYARESQKAAHDNAEEATRDE